MCVCARVWELESFRASGEFFVRSAATFAVVMGPPGARSHPDAVSSGGGGVRRDRSRSPPGALTDRVVLDRVDALVREVTALRGEFDDRVPAFGSGRSFSARIDVLIGEVLALRGVLECHLPGGR